MNYAIIDLGSNTIRLSIYNYENDKTEKILNRKETIGLAAYVSNGILEMEGIQKACGILNYFKLSALKFAEPSNIYLFAAASLRNVKNRDEAVKIIAKETSLFPDVLEGEEEAALAFAGASQSVDCDNGIMIDIGGASTELVLFNNYKSVELASLPIGCLNLATCYVKEVIPTKNERRKIKEEITKQLDKIAWSNNVTCPLMIGVGGTLRATLKLSRTLFDLPYDQNVIQAHYVKDILKQLKNNSNDTIYNMIYKAIPERIMTISTGLAILRQVIKKFDCETISLSEYGIREGYLTYKVLKQVIDCDLDSIKPKTMESYFL